MFCPNCGASVEENARFCVYCGSSLKQTAQQPQQESQPQAATQPDFDEFYTPQVPVSEQPPLKMGWFKFLIYFALFAGALINLSTGVQLLTGLIYGEDAELVYRYFDGLQTLDTLIGIAMIALAVLAIYTRFQLAAYRVKGPKLLSYVYIGSAVINLVYIIGVYALLPSEATEFLDPTSTITSIVISGLMVVANNQYFAKRSSLFVN